ncbi:MAG: hypothetical protein ACYCZB_14155 [Acidiphilium sp.]
MKPLFISTGNKGGPGKTTSAIAAVDLFLSLGRRVAVIETDSAQPDVRNRYQGTPNIVVGELDLAGDPEGALVRLGGWIESKSTQVDGFVVNSPAGGGAILDPHAGILAEVAGELNLTFCVAWILGPTVEDAEAVRRSMAGGLLGQESARRALGLAAWMGDPRAWPWSRSSVRTAAAAEGIAETSIPALTQIVMAQVIERNTTPLADLCAPSGGLSIAARSSLMRWRRVMHSTLTRIIDDQVEVTGNE